VWVASGGQLDEQGAQEAHRPTGVIIMTTGIRPLAALFEKETSGERKRRENDGHGSLFPLTRPTDEAV